MTVFLSRSLVVSLLVMIALALAGCSGADESSLQRSRDTQPTRLPARSNDAPSKADTTPAATPPASTPAPAPAPDAGAPPAPTPTPPPAPGSCGAPKCFGIAGVGGCKATDASGALVTMGCQDGACACVAADQTTTTFDGDVNSAEDARSLFLTNCTCN